MWLFIFSLNYLLPKHSVYSFSNSMVALVHLQIFEKQGMGSYSLTSYLLLWSSFSWIFVLVCLCSWVCSCLDYVRDCSHAYFCSVLGFIYVLLFVILSLSDCLIFIWCSMTCWFLLPILLDILSAKLDSFTTHHRQWPFGHSDKKGREIFEKQTLRGSTMLRGSSQKHWKLCLCFG